MARHEACHIVAALALGFPASGCLSGEPGREGKTDWDKNDEANNEEVIEVAVAAYVDEVDFLRLPEEHCRMRSGDDMRDIDEILKKYKKSQRTRIKDRCESDVANILHANRSKIDEIAADILNGKKITYFPEFLKE